MPELSEFDPGSGDPGIERERVRKMCAVSVNTFARAYEASSANIAKKAGNYDNKPLTKNTKIFLGLISFGLLYGLVELVEHFANVRPKIHEFAKLNCDLYNAIVNRASDQPQFTVFTKDRGELIFDIYQGAVYVVGSDGGVSLNVSSFEELLSRIHSDVANNPGYYDGLRLAPTVGSTMNLPAQIDGLQADDPVFQIMKTALYTVQIPGSKEQYKKILVDKFEKVVGYKLMAGFGTDWTSPTSSHTATISYLVLHTKYIDAVEALASKAFPNNPGLGLSMADEFS